MKRKNIILVLVLVLAGFATMQSCTKKDDTTFTIFKAAVPESPTPAAGEVVLLSGTSYTIKWTGTASTWDVYLGTSDKPGLAKAGVTGNSYTFTTTTGGEFFWYVSTVDVNKIVSKSPTWNFYINSAPSVPVLKVPAVDAVNSSVTGTLKWTKAVDPEGDVVTYDVYLGTTSTPSLFAANVADTILAPAMLPSTKYYWKVVAKDVHGYSTSSATVGSFTTGLVPLNYTVFGGVASEVSPSLSATAKFDVTLTVNTKGNFITMYLPLADGMVSAGWGTVYTGAHPIIIYYNPTTFAITSTKQLWTDSFVDPVEMGPMSLTVKSGTIDPIKKTLSILWTVSGNDYWGADYTLKATTYTMK